MSRGALLTVEQAAGVLGVHYKTALAYVSSGKLKAVMLGSRNKRIDPADLEAFIQAAKTCTNVCTETAIRVAPKASRALRVAPKKRCTTKDSSQQEAWYEKFK